MGICSSHSVDEQTKNIDKNLLKDHEKEAYKILLLGPGESGKSTFLKQLIELYGDDKNSDRPEEFRMVIYGNIILSIKTLIQKCEEFGEKFGGPRLSETSLNTSNDREEEEEIAEPELPEHSEQSFQSAKLREAVASLRTLQGEEDVETSVVDSRTAQQIHDVWSDPAIQATYEKRSTFQLHDSAKYFFDKIRDIGRDGYVPTVDDIIRCRLRTLGINEVTFNVGDAKFSVVDVGGQRSERNKWIHCFEKCSVLIFFASSSEYDQFLYEDETTNRMDEALGLFEQLATSRWFKGTKIILFLNKMDLLQEKLETTPLKVYFPECEATDYDSSCKYLRHKFESITSNKVTTHFTSVTNGSTIEQLFQDVMTVLLREQLKDKNLL